MHLTACCARHLGLLGQVASPQTHAPLTAPGPCLQTVCLANCFLNLHAWLLPQIPLHLDEDLEWEHMRRLLAACPLSPDITLGFSRVCTMCRTFSTVAPSLPQRAGRAADQDKCNKLINENTELLAEVCACRTTSIPASCCGPACLAEICCLSLMQTL